MAVCAVLAIPALAFGSAAMFSTENAVKAESALGIERQVDQLNTTVPAANEQPESAQLNADDRSAAVTNKASRPAANSQRFIDENSNCLLYTSERREQHILHGAEALRIGTAELRDALGKQLEDLPVALGFPRA